VVSVLATGPKVRGFKPGRGSMDFKGDKIHRRSHVRSHVVDLRMLGKIQRPCFSSTRCLLALLTDVPDGRIRVATTRLIVGLITPHHETPKGVPLKKKKKKYVQDFLLCCSTSKKE
jgi:hypothetical protein